MTANRPTIALLLDHFLGDYQTDVRNAVGFAAKERGADFLCFICRPIDSPNDYERIQNDIIRHVTPESASGVIVVGATLSVYSGKERIAQICRGFSPLPVCNIGLTIDDVPSVIVDNRRIGRAVEHLHKRHGCRKFAYIGGPRANEEAVLRRAGVQTTLSTLGLSLDPELDKIARFTRRTGCEAMTEILATRKEFDALVIANDTMALGALSILHKHGIRVPEDVRVTGFDDIPAAQFHSPSLSTIRQPIEEMSQRAVDMLLNMIAGEEVPRVTEVPPTLARRQSCGCSLTRRETLRFQGLVSLKSTDITDSIEENRRALEHSLRSNVRIPGQAFSAWAKRLVNALLEEAKGEQGRFVLVLEDILRSAEYRLWLIDELQNAVTVLREQLMDVDLADRDRFENMWHEARLVLSDAATYGQMQNQIAADLTSALFLRRAAAAPPTALFEETLGRAIAGEFETIGLENGLVSAFPPDAEGEQECVVIIRDGSIVPLDHTRYGIGAVLPPVMRRDRRMSFVVVTLTSGVEKLGVMVLELGAADLYYEILREHMSSHLKAIATFQNQMAERQKEADKHRRELELQHRQKLESLGVLAGGIAHDFNNMLSAMLGNLDAALFDLQDHGLQPAAILECKSVARHASGLCRQLLAYSGKGRFLVRRVNLNGLIMDLEDLLLVSVSKGVRLDLNLKEQLPDIEGDESQLTQIFVNLVINASESIAPHTGRISISTTTRHCDDSYLHRNIAGKNLTAGEYVIASVTDTGMGIEEEKLTSIFDPFYTTKFTGRGLGLAAVLGIVSGHRGAIRVTSNTREETHGTRFEILFPILPKTGISRKDTSSPPPWLGQGTILMVDDEPSVLRAGRRLLERMGFSVVTASNGQEGIDVFGKMDDAISCIILDITMPGKGGVETMLEIREMNRSIPIILTSGYSEEQAVAPLHDEAPAAFLQKPYDYQKLNQVLKSVLGVTTASPASPPP